MDEERLAELERRVADLEDKVVMLSQIADFQNHPFIFSVLEANMNGKQVDQVLDLMTKAEDSLKTNKPMNHVEFESALYKIVPSQNGNYQFAKTIVMTLHDEERFDAVYEQFKKTGMNI
jgi:hypothetical protein